MNNIHMVLGFQSVWLERAESNDAFTQALEENILSWKQQTDSERCRF